MSDISVHSNTATRRLIAVLCCTVVAMLLGVGPTSADAGVGDVIQQTQPKIVKIYGAGGFGGLEAYQSGFLISAEGHILTSFSYVLDTDYISVTLDDGRKFDAKLLGADPRLEVAVLKIEAEGLPHFDLDEAAEVGGGTRVLAFSNAFGVAMGNEPATVQHGVVSVKADLAAKRGVFDTPYRGPVYVLDAMTNNPGATGGALVARDGRCLAMLGKELKNSTNDTWLNYAVPIAELRGSVDDILQGKLTAKIEDREAKKPARSLELASLGIVLVPDIVSRTPPYVDEVRPGSPAEKSGIAADDLIVLMGDRLVQSCKILVGELEYVDFEDSIKLSVLRGGELIEFVLRADIQDDGGQQ